MDVGGSPYAVVARAGSWALIKSDGHSHTVFRHGGGPWRCTCDDFRYRGRRRPCKHIRSLIAAGME